MHREEHGASDGLSSKKRNMRVGSNCLAVLEQAPFHSLKNTIRPHRAQNLLPIAKNH